MKWIAFDAQVAKRCGGQRAVYIYTHGLILPWPSAAQEAEKEIPGAGARRGDKNEVETVKCWPELIVADGAHGPSDSEHTAGWDDVGCEILVELSRGRPRDV